MWNCGPLLLLALAIIININGAYSEKPKLGSAINMVNRYGHLAENMRVMERNTTDTWIYREPSVPVFKTPPTVPDLTGGRRVFMILGHIHVAYFSHVRKLVQDYFSGFNIEGVDRTARAFTTDWSDAAIARHFGLNKSFIANKYSYVVLKVMLSRDTKQMYGSPYGLEFDEAVVRESESVIVNDTASTDRFINNFGTHYISSYSTGDMLYQVFVVKRRQCNRLKARLENKTLDQLSGYERSFYFSPRRSVHVGRVQAASGSRVVESWAAENLVGRYPNITNEHYTSLIELHGNYDLFEQLDTIYKDQALLRMELKLLSPVFKSPMRRGWFEKYVEKHLKEPVTKPIPPKEIPKRQ